MAFRSLAKISQYTEARLLNNRDSFLPKFYSVFSETCSCDMMCFELNVSKNIAWTCTLTTNEPYWISRSYVKGQGHFSLVDQISLNFFCQT